MTIAGEVFRKIDNGNFRKASGNQLTDSFTRPYAYHCARGVSRDVSLQSLMGEKRATISDGQLALFGDAELCGRSSADHAAGSPRN